MGWLKPIKGYLLMLGVGVLVSSISMNLYMGHRLKGSIRELQACSSKNLSLTTTIESMRLQEALRQDVSDSLQSANTEVDEEIGNIREDIKRIRELHTEQCEEQQNEEETRVDVNSGRRLTDESIKLLKSRVRND